MAIPKETAEHSSLKSATNSSALQQKN